MIIFPEGAARDRLETAMVEATQAIVADARMIADSDRSSAIPAPKSTPIATGRRWRPPACRS